MEEEYASEEDYYDEEMDMRDESYYDENQGQKVG